MRDAMTGPSTAERILEEARGLIARRGYNGFSYADISDAIGIRKASIHHHFASKADLAIAVVEQSRAATLAHMAATQGAPDARAQLRGYIGYWRMCIADDSAPFCIAAMLAAELPGLPPELAAAVRRHFDDLTAWLTDTLALGVAQGTVTLAGTPQDEAEAFLSAVYGAMLSARAFGDPLRFGAITDRLLSGMIALR